MMKETMKKGKPHKGMPKWKEYLLLNLGVLLIAIGVYFFKIPNNLAIGGVSGMSVILGAVTENLSPENYIFILNVALLIIGFLFFGRSFGLKTVYTSILLSVLIDLFSRIFPMSGPLTDVPMLELVFGVLLPGIGAGLLFNIHASSGGTDIIAMIFKKYTHLDIGRALFAVDILVTSLTLFVFDIQTALLSILGLITKSLLVDVTIENMNRVKYFFIVTEKPDAIIDFITISLHRGGTEYQGYGIYTGEEKTIITTVVSNFEAVELRDFINHHDPHAFVTIVNTSQIIGKGFHFAD